MNTTDNNVKDGLTPIPKQRRGKTVETAEFSAFAKRIMRAFSKRVGDEADIESLADLVALSNEIDVAIANAVYGLRKANPPYSWAEIGRVLGITKQAAQQRWGGTE